MPSCWIFISYRRHETVYHSQLIFEKLDKEFGRDHVFLDTKSIQPGERFPEKISEALQSTSILIALIEKDWLSIKNQDGQQRLFLDVGGVRDILNLLTFKLFVQIFKVNKLGILHYSINTFIKIH